MQSAPGGEFTPYGPAPQSSSSRSCHACKQYTAVGQCARCAMVTTCPQCAVRPDVAARHARICFSITEPTSGVEALVATALGGLGPVHQWVTSSAWAAAAAKYQVSARLVKLATRRGDRLSPVDLVAGVIYNDFPVEDELDADASYVRSMLVPIAPPSFPGITDPSFLWQPSAHVRWANAAVYKGVYGGLLELAGVEHETLEQARRTLKLRTDTSRVCYHFMRRSAHETPAEVLAAAMVHAERWFRLAVLHRSLFLLGHIVHMVEDSFSPAHTARDLVRTLERPFGTVTNVYFFGTQGDRAHSSQESAYAATTPGSEAARRITVCVDAVRDLLALFVTTLEQAPIALPGGAVTSASLDAQARYAQQQATGAFRTFMQTQVFFMATAGA